MSAPAAILHHGILNLDIFLLTKKKKSMKLSDAIEQVFFENKLIGVRCKLCGELMVYSSMSVADDHYGVKEHYKELHPEVDIELVMLNASFNRMAEDGFKRELRKMRKRTGYECPIIVSSSFGEDSWYSRMVNELLEKFRKEDEDYWFGKIDGKYIPKYTTLTLEDSLLKKHLMGSSAESLASFAKMATANHNPFNYIVGIDTTGDVKLCTTNDVKISNNIGFYQSIDDTPEWFIKEWCESDHSKDVVRDTGTEWNGFFVDHNFVEKLNEIKKDYDMNNKKKVSDNPYNGGTLYSVIRDRILEREKLPLNCTISNDKMVRELLHTPMEELVQMLVQHELEKANAKFPPFFDEMHGWAVLKEEIEEADEELVNIKRWHDQIWIAIRGNRKLHSDYIRLIKTLAKKLMVEAAQVAAMADKYEAMLERNEKKEE